MLDFDSILVPIVHPITVSAAKVKPMIISRRPKKSCEDFSSMENVKERVSREHNDSGYEENTTMMHENPFPVRTNKGCKYDSKIKFTNNIEEGDFQTNGCSIPLVSSSSHPSHKLVPSQNLLLQGTANNVIQNSLHENVTHDSLYNNVSQGSLHDNLTQVAFCHDVTQDLLCDYVNQSSLRDNMNEIENIEKALSNEKNIRKGVVEKIAVKLSQEWLMMLEELNRDASSLLGYLKDVKFIKDGDNLFTLSVDQTRFMLKEQEKKFTSQSNIGTFIILFLRFSL